MTKSAADKAKELNPLPKTNHMALIRKTLSPQQADTLDKICQLKEDNTDTLNFWFMVDEDTVTITKQGRGESSEWMHSIPRKDFNKFVKWYLKSQPVKPTT
jgi:hypothetical protein